MNRLCETEIFYVLLILYSVNLTTANSVHIMEPQWNPMVEAQAVDRIHRIGQERPVTVIRYFVKDSIESVRTQCLERAYVKMLIV